MRTSAFRPIEASKAAIRYARKTSIRDVQLLQTNVRDVAVPLDRQANRVSRLQGRGHARRATAAHEAEMAAVLTRHRLDDRRMLAMPADADDEPLVAPLHAQRS